jgi:hypothetical protein
MKHLRKTFAALGFVCFVSLALLPVSLTVCGPITARLFHHAKRLHHAVSAAALPQLGAVPTQRVAFERDIISEADPVRTPWEHAAAARSPAGPEPDRPELHWSQGFIDSAKVSNFVFHTVLIL